MNHPRHQFLLFFSSILLMVGWYHKQFKIADNPINNIEKNFQVHRQTSNRYFPNHAALNEFLPKTAASHMINEPRNNSPNLKTDPPAVLEPLKGINRHQFHYHLKVNTNTSVLVNQLYFPGWKVMVNKNPISRKKLEEQLFKDGRMGFIPPKDEHSVETFYEDPPGWRIRNIIMVFSIVGFVFYCLINYNRFQS